MYAVSSVAFYNNTNHTYLLSPPAVKEMWLRRVDDFIDLVLLSPLERLLPPGIWKGWLVQLSLLGVRSGGVDSCTLYCAIELVVLQ